MPYVAYKKTDTTKEIPIIDRAHPPVIQTFASSGDIKAGEVITATPSGVKACMEHTDTAGTGNGSSKTFTYTAQGNVCDVAVSDGTQILRDNGYGQLIGDGSGTIDYENGEIKAVFATAVPNATSVSVSYVDRPLGVALHAALSGETVDVVVHGVVDKEQLSGTEVVISSLEKHTQLYLS